MADKWSEGGVGIGCGMVALAAAIAIVGACWAMAWTNVEYYRNQKPAVEAKP